MTAKRVLVRIGTPRERDERVLAWLALRSAGWGCAAIARAYGVPRSEVHVSCDRVRADDLKYSGEPEDIVKAGYW